MSTVLMEALIAFGWMGKTLQPGDLFEAEENRVPGLIKNGQAKPAIDEPTPVVDLNATTSEDGEEGSIQ